MGKFVFSEMTVEHYEEVISLWSDSPGIDLSGADSRENIELYLQRNPCFSLVARLGEDLVGAVLCGHDGRRGYLHHLAVRESCRRMGLGRELARRCLEKLHEAKIEKCHLFLVANNLDGLAFWQENGWQIRNDLLMLSKNTGEINGGTSKGSVQAPV